MMGVVIYSYFKFNDVVEMFVARGVPFCYFLAIHFLFRGYGFLSPFNKMATAA